MAGVTPIPAFLDEVVEFPDGKSYKLLRSLTDYRKCHDGTPVEARILFTCQQIKPVSSEEEFVVKIKIQAPEHDEPQEGPSTTTSAELKALQKFTDANFNSSPHIINYKQTLQDERGPLPGGYITFTVMTKKPGDTLFSIRYWDLPEPERDEIVTKFLAALRDFGLCIEERHVGARNEDLVRWHFPDHCMYDPTLTPSNSSIIDFELWQPTNEVFADRMKTLQKWGLARRPPPRDWFMEWGLQGR